MTFTISLGKSLTTNPFNLILKKDYNNSFNYSHINFDMKLIEWVSLPELLQLIKWINILTIQGCKIYIEFPITHFVDGVDEFTQDIHGGMENLKPMHRRSRALSFLVRLGFHDEIQRITNNPTSNSLFPDEKTDKNSLFNNLNDPYEATILPIRSFANKKDLDLKKEFSNQTLRTLLREYSVLDYVDSGLLSDVLIEELVTNAITHGVNAKYTDETRTLPCAWLSARLVKSSFSLVKESPGWLSSTIKSLVGKHYLEIALCDSGFGIYDQLREYTPEWIFSREPSVKAILDYAFDKFSTSSNKLRTEQDILPRGLFWVRDLLRQYGGLIIIRSNGYYMGYDFFSKRENPRLLSLWNKEGSCQNTPGTSIQLILPEAKRIPLSIFANPVPSNYKKPTIFLVDPPRGDSIIREKVQNIAKEIESFCYGGGDFSIYIDFMSFDLAINRHREFFALLIRYIIYFQNPQLFWLIIPKDLETLSELNSIITNEGHEKTSSEEFEYIFHDLTYHDKRIIPVIFPDRQVYWLGANEAEMNCLQYLYGTVEASFEEFGCDHSIVLHMAQCNPNLLSLKYNPRQLGKSKISFNFDIFNISNSIIDIIDNVSESIIRQTKNTIHQAGSYHLPHGSYSNYYLYLKPALIQNDINRRLSRYIITKISYTKGLSTRDIDTVIGGTHSAKRLIYQISNELSSEYLTIDRYIDQINEPSIEPKVANKNVIIITDVISSGSFVEMISKKLINYGSKVIAICAIADLRENFREEINSIQVISLFRFRVERLSKPNRTPIYEINTISLRPGAKQNSSSIKKPLDSNPLHV